MDPRLVFRSDSAHCTVLLHMEVSGAEEYNQRFDPGQYLTLRYSEVDANHHQHVFEGLHELFSSGKFTGGKILELGCGPVMAWQISAAPHASEIVLAELVESSRDAVRLWLDKDPRAHDWTPFFRHVVQTLEGKGEEEVAKREEQLRRTVKAVIPCNATKDPPVPPGYEGPYDVVMAMAVLETCTDNEASLTAAWVRLAKLLKPGGILVSKTYLVEGLPAPTHTYLAGAKETFVAMNISEEMLRQCLKAAGLSDVKLRKSPTDHSSNHTCIQGGATFAGSVFFTAVKVK